MLFLAVILTSLTFANLPIAPAEQWLEEGFLPVDPRPIASMSVLNNRYPWPVKFQDESHTVANSMAQYQPFGDPYFHGGCDLRVAPREKIFASVAGKLEAGHYGYSKRSDGSLQKFWKPWPQSGDAFYFEIAVIDAQGIRHEYHHVDRNSLTSEIVALLNQGQGVIAAGTEIGRTVYWPTGDYHHIHLNMILPNETRLNPEYFSTEILDTEAPEIYGIYAITPSEILPYGEGNFLTRPTEFVIHTSDRKNSSVYENPPVFLSLNFENGASYQWDFRRQLLHNDKFPNLREFFQFTLRTPEGKFLRTEGGYGTGKSLIRLPVPIDGSGSFVIRIEDQAGNFKETRGTMP